jgi:hypothetical protein
LHVKKSAVLEKAGFLFVWVQRQQQTNGVDYAGAVELQQHSTAQQNEATCWQCSFFVQLEA